MQTGEQLLGIFNSITEDVLSGTASAGAQNSLTDDGYTIAQFGKMDLAGRWLRMTSGTGNIGHSRVIVSNDAGEVEVRGQFPAAIANGATWEIHRWQPDSKLRAIDRARLAAFPLLCVIVEDTSLYADGEQELWPIPVTIRSGPFTVRSEARENYDDRANIIEDDGWTAPDGVLAVRDSNSDLVIPRSDTAYRASLGAGEAMTQDVAVDCSGRRVAAWGWVYCEDADANVKLGVGDSRSLAHPGGGWAYMTVEHVAAEAMPAVTVNAERAATVWVESVRAGLGMAKSMRLGGYVQHSVIRDASGAMLRLEDAPERGRQLYLRGRYPLSAVAGDPANHMEIDEAGAHMLCTLAVEELFLALAIPLSESLTTRINAARARLERFGSTYSTSEPSPPIQLDY